MKPAQDASRSEDSGGLDEGTSPMFPRIPSAEFEREEFFKDCSKLKGMEMVDGLSRLSDDSLEPTTRSYASEVTSEGNNSVAYYNNQLTFSSKGDPSTSSRRGSVDTIADATGEWSQRSQQPIRRLSDALRSDKSKVDYGSPRSLSADVFSRRSEESNPPVQAATSLRAASTSALTGVTAGPVSATGGKRLKAESSLHNHFEKQKSNILKQLKAVRIKKGGPGRDVKRKVVTDEGVEGVSADITPSRTPARTSEGESEVATPERQQRRSSPGRLKWKESLSGLGFSLPPTPPSNKKHASKTRRKTFTNLMKASEEQEEEGMAGISQASGSDPEEYLLAMRAVKALLEVGALKKKDSQEGTRRRSTSYERTGRRSGSELWDILRDAVKRNEVLKQDIQLSKKLFGRGPKKLSGSQSGRMEEKEAVREEKPHLVYPESKFRRYWDVTQFLILIYISVAVPFRVGFSIVAKGVDFAWEVSVDCFFLADIVLNFLSVYEDHDLNLVTDLGMIARHYLSTWFVVDVMSIFPLDYAMHIMDGTFLCSFELAGCPPDHQPERSGYGQFFKAMKMLRLVRLTKLLGLARMNRLMARYQDELFNLTQVLVFVKLVFVMLFVGHVFGCLFYYFSTDEWHTEKERELIEAGDLVPWLRQQYGDQYASTDLGGRYLAALYWSFSTMSTVGYGDLIASTKAERIFAILGMIVGSFIFSFFIGNMLSELETANMQRTAFNHKMMSVKSYVNDLRLSREMRIAVLSYFRTQETKAYDERAILFELPFEMRNSILQTLYQDIISQVPLFKDGDEVYRTELCSRVQPVTFSKGTFIFRRGELGKEMYIITQGEVELVDPRGKRIYSVLGMSSYFGEGCVLGASEARLETVRCRTTVGVLALHRDDMSDLLHAYPAMSAALSVVYEKRKKVFCPPEEDLVFSAGDAADTPRGDDEEEDHREGRDKKVLLHSAAPGGNKKPQQSGSGVKKKKPAGLDLPIQDFYGAVPPMFSVESSTPSLTSTSPVALHRPKHHGRRRSRVNSFSFFSLGGSQPSAGAAPASQHHHTEFQSSPPHTASPFSSTATTTATTTQAHHLHPHSPPRTSPPPTSSSSSTPPLSSSLAAVAVVTIPHPPPSPTPFPSDSAPSGFPSPSAAANVSLTDWGCTSSVSPGGDLDAVSAQRYCELSPKQRHQQHQQALELSGEGARIKAASSSASVEEPLRNIVKGHDSRAREEEEEVPFAKGSSSNSILNDGRSSSLGREDAVDETRDHSPASTSHAEESTKEPMAVGSSSRNHYGSPTSHHHHNHQEHHQESHQECHHQHGHDEDRSRRRVSEATRESTANISRIEALEEGVMLLNNKMEMLEDGQQKVLELLHQIASNQSEASNHVLKSHPPTSNYPSSTSSNNH